MDPILQALIAQDPTLGGSLPPAQPPAAPGVEEFGFDPVAAAYAQGTQPAPGPEVPPPAPTPPPDLSGASSAVSGLDRGTQAYLQTGAPTSRYERNLAGLRAEEDRRGQQVTDARIDLANRQRSVTGKVGELSASRAGDLADNARKQAAEQLKMAGDIEKIHESAWQKVNESQAQYQGQLAAVRAMRIDPSGALDDKGRIVNGLRSFVNMQLLATGKPAMVAVARAGLDSLDADIKRSVDAQVKNLDNQKDVAEGFKSLWEVASRNAVSEEQAKARVQGMILQAMKDSMAADVATKYDSDLARAAAEEASVGIDQKLLESASKDREQATKFYLDAAELATRKYTAELDASTASKRLAFDREVEKAKGGKKPSLKEMGLFPVGDPETKEFRYSAKTEKGQEILDDLGSSSDAFSKSMENLESYVREAGGDLIGGTDQLGKLKDSKDKKVAALARTVSFNLAKMLNPDGKISDADAAAAADSLSVASILTRDDGVEARDAIRNFVVDNTQSYYGQYAVDVDPKVWEQLGYPSRGAQAPVQVGQRAQANTQAPVTSKVAKAAAAVSTPDSRGEDWVSLEDADRQWASYVTSGGNYRGDGQEERGAMGNVFPRGVNRVKDYVRQPAWADDVSALGAFASDPRLPQAQRLEARRKLEDIKADGEDVDKAYYAKHILDGLGNSSKE